MRKISRSFIGLLAIILWLTACTPAVVQPTAIPSEGGASTEAEQPDVSPGSLVLYSGRSESLVGPIIQQFSDASGIEVEVRYGNTAEIAATLLEEGDNTPADVFWAQDPGGLGAVAEAGMLTTLP
ncbi:MAG TPA: substrate-binding domain-containing protein, partial [Anaerolineales bacterium]|nr:substrate-binding domain-containing protein [Anaerolineales bacterium]